MKIKSNNPPAFPALHLDGHRGMSLRDYFAAKAMQGMDPHKWTCIDELSKKSYEIADAMLKQREL